MGLIVRNLTVSFGKHRVLDDLSIPEIHHGEVVSLIGKNGAGKSTLLKQMTRIVKMHPHCFELDGEPLHLKDVGYLPQEHRIGAALTVLELLITTMHVGVHSLFTQADSVDRALELLEEIGILHLAGKLCTELSGGESQMVGLAQALINRPKVLILDEPTAALDMHNQLRMLENVRSYVRREKACAIMVVHDLNLAIQYSDRVAALCGGKLLTYGSPYELINEELIATLFHVNSEIVHVDDRPVVIVKP